jgi:hypothetical protein
VHACKTSVGQLESEVDIEVEAEAAFATISPHPPSFLFCSAVIMLRTPLIRSRARLCAPRASPVVSQLLLNRSVRSVHLTSIKPSN